MASIAAGLSPIGIGSDVAISLRGPGAHTGIVALKATHGRIPMTDLWPRVPRRFWHVVPMARTVRDISLGYSLLAGPDGSDGRYPSSPLMIDAGVGADPHFQRFGLAGWWNLALARLIHDVAATVQAAAEALESAGVIVEYVRIPVLEQIDFDLDVFWKLQLMKPTPNPKATPAGHEGDVFKYAQSVLDRPDTSIGDFVQAEQQSQPKTKGRVRQVLLSCMTHCSAR